MGSFLDKPATEKETVTGSGNGMDWGMSAMQGWRVDMEDAHIAKTEITKWPESAIFGVFDGHGGKTASKYAASHLLNRVSSEAGFKPDASVDEVKTALRTAFLDLDAELRRLPAFASGEDHSGTTAVTVLVTPGHHICANAGDSRSVLCRSGAAVPLSEDHKPYNPIERKRITEAGGTVSMNRVNGDLAVSRAFGDFGYKNTPSKSPEAQMVSPEPEFIVHDRSNADEFVIVACDGIWDVMSNEECVKHVREMLECYDTLGGVCENLIDTCLDLGSKDNMSAIIITFPSAPKPDPAKVKAQAAKDAEAKAKREEQYA